MLKSTNIIKKYNNIFVLHDANAAWREVLHLAIEQKIPKGYTWNNIQEQHSFAFLESGSIRLYCHNFNSRERIILQMGSGCIFREVGLLYASQRYNIYQKALEDCIIYNFPANLLQNHDFIVQYPYLITNVINTIGAKLGCTISLLAEGLKPSPKVMVSQYLVNFINTPEQQRTQLGISQGELALALGLHRSTVCKVLKELREANAIGQINKNIIKVFDKDYLQNIIDA